MDLVPQGGTGASPVMDRSIRLHPHQAWRQVREEGQHLYAMQPLCQRSGARLVDGVCLKHAFRQSSPIVLIVIVNAPFPASGRSAS